MEDEEGAEDRMWGYGQGLQLDQRTNSTSGSSLIPVPV